MVGIEGEFAARVICDCAGRGYPPRFGPDRRGQYEYADSDIRLSFVESWARMSESPATLEAYDFSVLFEFEVRSTRAP